MTAVKTVESYALSWVVPRTVPQVRLEEAAPWWAFWRSPRIVTEPSNEFFRVTLRGLSGEQADVIQRGLDHPHTRMVFLRMMAAAGNGDRVGALDLRLEPDGPYPSTSEVNVDGWAYAGGLFTVMGLGKRRPAW